MILPDVVVSMLEEKLGTAISGASRVGGGCISETARLDLADGDRVFVKWAHAREHTYGLFRSEAISLRAIIETTTVRVPGVVDVVDAAHGYSFLLLEWLEPGSSNSESWAALGSKLAELHRYRSPARAYGWLDSNFIGSLPQSNRLRKQWADFWRAERIVPQLDAASSRFSKHDRARFDKLLSATSELLAEANYEGPSLLHGDLWNGNVHMLASGGAALVDPSSYYGHREVDLAMSKLFGGFTRHFYQAYHEAWPLEPGSDQRMLMYQLYYLLVHVNLFGDSYVPNTLSVLDQLGF